MESLVGKGLVLALFEESAHTLLLILRFKAGAERLLLDDDSLVHRKVKALVDGLLGCAHRDGRVGRNLRSELLRRAVQLLERINGVDKTDAQRFLRLDVAGGVDLCLAMPGPTRRARRCVPPKPGVMPRPVSGWPKTAVSEQMRKSQLIESSQPPPRA